MPRASAKHADATCQLVGARGSKSRPVGARNRPAKNGLTESRTVLVSRRQVVLEKEWMRRVLVAISCVVGVAFAVPSASAAPAWTGWWKGDGTAADGKKFKVHFGVKRDGNPRKRGDQGPEGALWLEQSVGDNGCRVHQGCGHRDTPGRAKKGRATTVFC